MSDTISNQMAFYTKRAAVLEGNISFNSTSPQEQKPYLVGEQWAFELYQESIVTQNSLMMANKRKAEQNGLYAFASRFDSLKEAIEFIKQLNDKLNTQSAADFNIEQIDKRGIDPESKVYVLVYVRPILSWGQPPEGYKYSSENGCYVPHGF